MFNNKKILVTLLSIFAILSPQVQAEPYVSGQVGVYGVGRDNNFFNNIFDNSDLRATGRIGAGYLWAVNPSLKLGLETGFQAYQDQKFSEDDISVKFKRNTVDVLGVIDYQPIDEMNFFAKAGPAYAMQKVTLQDISADFKSNQNAVVPKGVIGVGYNLSDQVNLNLSLNHEFKKKNSDIDCTSSASSVMAGVTYRFS